MTVTKFNPANVVMAEHVNSRGKFGGPKSSYVLKVNYTEIGTDSANNPLFRSQYTLGTGIWDELKLNENGFNLGKDRETNNAIIQVVPEDTAQVLRRRKGAINKSRSLYMDQLTQWLVEAGLIEQGVTGIYYLKFEVIDTKFPDWFYILNDDQMDNELDEGNDETVEETEVEEVEAK